MTAPFWEKSYPAGVTWAQNFQAKPIWTLFDDAVARFAPGPAWSSWARPTAMPQSPT